MKQTELLTKILEKAEEIKSEYKSKELCALHIAVAFKEFCDSEYTGFCISDKTFFPNWYEEERLRLIFAKVLKNSFYFRVRLKKAVRDGEENLFPFDLKQCERFALLRNNDILSADLVLLCVLESLKLECKSLYKVEITEDTIIELLEYIDANIYDYTAKKAQEASNKLMQKATEAAAKRDWKPAEKFAEPQEVLKLIFASVQRQTANNVTTLKFPKFFGAADLKISIHKADGSYYIHDNGCAIKHLSKRINDRKKLERVLNKVCHPSWIYKGKITGCFTNSFGFFEYLRRLIFIANADLYYTKASSKLCQKEKGYSYIPKNCAEPLNQEELMKILKDGIDCHYDQNSGLYLRMDAKCSLSSPRLFVDIETLENGYIRLSDRKKGKYEGEIFEEFYWNNDDITPYSHFVEKLAARFGAQFDGRDIYLTEKTAKLPSAVSGFLNLAVLLTEFGHNIDLPKPKVEVK